MIKFEFVLCNPWSSEVFANKWNRTFHLFKHKYLEFQLYRFTSEILGLRLNTMWRGRDHAGLELELVFLGYTLDILLYDSRHWDYGNNTWDNQGDTHD